MSFEDFLTPALPGLIYESHSEQSQSPHSNHENSEMEHDWLKWDRNASEFDHFQDDPLFSMLPEDRLLQASLHEQICVPHDKAPGSFDASSSRDNLPILVDPQTLTCDFRPLDDIKNDTFGVQSTISLGKRKLSGSSSDASVADIISNSEDAISAKQALHAQGNEVLRRKYGGVRPPKISHNVIEKRYRSNLNDKINDLRDTVPTLRAEVESGNTKHPKGRIIQAAAEYIREMERRCSKLQAENERLTTKLHAERQPKGGHNLSKVVVGGLASMMCASSLPTGASTTSSHMKRDFNGMNAATDLENPSFLQNCLAVLKMILLVAAILYIFNPTLFLTNVVKSREHNQGKYSQSALDDSMQEDLQENREAMHNNVSAMLQMPCDRPGLFKRILQGCFVLTLEMIIGQSGWNVLFNRGLDYAQTRQNACKMLIETQLLGGDKHINQAKLFLSAIQSLGYTMPKEMRALHFAMVCHGYVPANILQWLISLFWFRPVQSDDNAVLQLPLAELFSARVLEAMWAWTTGIEDPLIANVRSDETIGNPLKQLSSIHASLMQNCILRAWLRGTESALTLDEKMETLLQYSPRGSKIMINSLYLRSMIEPNDWLERAMAQSIQTNSTNDAEPFSHEVAMQLRCCVLLNLLEKDPKDEEVSDVLQMVEVETSSLLPGYSSRMVSKCISKYRLDDDDGISDALRRICAMIGSSARLDLNFGRDL